MNLNGHFNINSAF